MSRFPDSQAVAQDALLHPWDETTYLFPPVTILRKRFEVCQRAEDLSSWWPAHIDPLHYGGQW